MTLQARGGALTINATPQSSSTARTYSRNVAVTAFGLFVTTASGLILPSFLTRHFTTPPGPVVKDGEPTRQALQAAAWGEPIPKSESDEKKLAAKGRKLLAEAKEGK